MADTWTSGWAIPRKKSVSKSTVFGSPITTIPGPGPLDIQQVYTAPPPPPKKEDTGPPKLDFIPQMQTLTDEETGMPTSTGYYDENDVWVETRNWDRLSGMMQTLEGYQIPTPTPLVGSESWNLMMALAERSEAGFTTQDVTTATEQAATMAGLEPGVYQQLAGDVAAGRGLTPEQNAVFERSTLRSTREAERFAQNQLNTIRAGSGSSYRQWTAVEAGINSINDVRTAGQLAQINANLERTAQKMSQIEGIAGSAQNQLAMLQQGWGQAAQVYANQLLTIYQENVQEREAIAASAQLTLNAIDAELGFGTALTQAELDSYEQYLAPHREQTAQWALEADAASTETEKTQANWGLVISGLAALAAFFLLFT